MCVHFRKAAIAMPVQNNYAYRIEGGRPVVGEITCLGAKNFITKAMVAALLGDTPTKLMNVPPIGDVDITKEMLTSVGVAIEHNSDDSMIIDGSTLRSSIVPMPHSGSNRIPILLLGAMLHRSEKVEVPIVRGCNIGARTVDFH